MARTNNLANFLTDVAGAIKQKTGNNIPIPAANFDIEISNIQTGGVYQEKELNINQNGNYILNPDQGYDALSRVRIGVNVSSGGSSEVKQFSSVEEMNASTGNVEGDLAIVYANSIRNLEIDDKFDSVIFPNTVVLPVVPPVTVYARFTTVNPSLSSRFQFAGSIRAISATFTYQDMANPSSSKQITYTTSDGITYTRTDTLGNPIQLDTLFKHNPSQQFIPTMEGPFMQITSHNFDGLFIYIDNHWQLAETQLNAEAGYVYQKKFYGKNGPETGSLQNVTNLSTDDVTFRRNIRNLYSNMSVSNASNFFMSNSTLISFNPTTSVSDVVFENLVNTRGMFYNCTNLTTVSNMDTSNVTNMAYMFNTCYKLNSVPNYDTGNVTSMTNMFAGCTQLRTLYNFNTANVTNMDGMFSACGMLTSTPNYDTSNVTNMALMFSGCNNLTSVPNFNTSKVVDMSNMFQVCNNLTTVPNLNTSYVTNMRRMFRLCNKLNSVPNFNTRNVTDMALMFEGCINLVNVPEFDMSNVTILSSMFQNCYNLQSVSNLNIGKANSTYNMFSTCNNLLTVSNLNTSNVVNMANMFGYCNRLASISNFDTSNVTSMSFMFTRCNNLTTVPNFDTSNVTSMRCMFTSCERMTTIPNFNTSNMTNMDGMFRNCQNLVSIPEFDTSKVTDMTSIVMNCNRLSNTSVQNIVNMVLNCNITNTTLMNLNNENSYSPLYRTIFNTSYYSNRLAELTAAGWAY